MSRVLCLVPSFLGNTGEDVNERQLISALAKRSQKCYVVTFAYCKHYLTVKKSRRRMNIPSNIVVILIPVPNRPLKLLAMIVVSYIMGMVTLLRFLGKIDLIYIRTSFLSIGFLVFKSLAKKTIVKIPAITEDEIPEVWGQGILAWLFRKVAHTFDLLTLTRARKIAVNSWISYSYLIRKRGFKRKDKPLIMPPGVNWSLIEKVKRQLKKDESKNYMDIGFIGALSWWQGVDILAEALALLKNKIPKLRLVIIGDGEMRSEIEEICKKYDITYDIMGFLPHEEALKHFAKVDVLVLPRRRLSSTEANIPIKVVEAWALGVPVIATKHRVFLEYNIRNFEDIIYCEPEPTDVAKNVLRLINDNKLRGKIIKNGQKLAIQFNYDIIVERLLREFKNITNARTNRWN